MKNIILFFKSLRHILAVKVLKLNRVHLSGFCNGKVRLCTIKGWATHRIGAVTDKEHVSSWSGISDRWHVVRQ